MDYGEILLDFRARHNLTQTQLAELLGVTVFMVYRYEKHINKPSMVNRIKFDYKMKEWEKEKNENSNNQ